MKRIMQSLLRRLDIRVSRASSIDRLLAHIATSEQKAAELERKLAALFVATDIEPVVGTAPEPIDDVIAKIPVRGTVLTAPVFADICAAYSALRSSGARQRISEQVLKAMLASDPSQPDVLSEACVRSLATHDLYRQAAAARALAAGRLHESAAAWQRISDSVPSSFNLACYGRVLVASDDRRNAFAVLADAVELYPRSALLSTELAMFFMRLGDVESANVALGAVRHAFLDERSALTDQQAELDRAIDEARVGRPDDASNPSGSERARDAAARTLMARIMSDSGGELTGMVEAKPATLNADQAGSHVLLYQAAAAESCYPAQLAQFYRRCNELGIKHLVMSETLDFDRTDLRYHKPGEFPRITRLGGGGRLLHDFKRLLADAGYSIANTVAVRPEPVPSLTEPDPGYRLLHAKRHD
jgi:hypothetical protein